MHSPLVAFIDAVKTDRDRIQGFDEAKTVQYIILRILSMLGWDIFEEVIPEYMVLGGKVDLAVQRGGVNRIFVEAKRVGADLETHQDQLLRYAFSEGVKLGVMTSGVSWWLYLPLAEGSWEQRRFFAIDLLEQDSTAAADNFIRFLEAERVVSGEALRSAEAYRQSRQRVYILHKTLPLAWNKLVSQPDELLLDMLIETTESLSGYRAEQEMVARFLAQHRRQLLVPEPGDTSDIGAASQAPVTPTTGSQIAHASDLTGSKPTAFAIGDRVYEINYWIEMLGQVCDCLYERDPHRFMEAALSLKGRKRPYFTCNPDELRSPWQFRDTDLYIEANQSASSIYMRCRSLLALFDHDPEALRVWTAE